MVLQSAAPWLSHADISAGDRWADTVAKELDASDFGITCITRENSSSPWIHFEAGALAKRMQEGRVIPLLLDLDFKDISGPLAQFQAKKADREGLLGVVNAVNELSDVKVSETLLPKQFDALWPSLESAIEAIPKTQLPARQQRPQHEVLEELVTSVRGLDVRVRETVEDSPSGGRRRLRMHPMMMMDFVHFSRGPARGENGLLSLLVAISFLRDDLPWVYDLGLEAYLQTSRKSPNAKRARQSLFDALRMLRRGPFEEMLGTKESYMVLREIEHYTREFTDLDDDQQEDSDPIPPISKPRSLRKPIKSQP